MKICSCLNESDRTLPALVEAATTRLRAEGGAEPRLGVIVNAVRDVLWEDRPRKECNGCAVLFAAAVKRVMDIPAANENMEDSPVYSGTFVMSADYHQPEAAA